MYIYVYLLLYTPNRYIMSPNVQPQKFNKIMGVGHSFFVSLILGQDNEDK